VSWNGGRKSRRLAFDVAFAREARTVHEVTRWGLWAWLQRWWWRPQRVFWELDPKTGEWKRL
jgi:hypothetical protein